MPVIMKGIRAQAGLKKLFGAGWPSDLKNGRRIALPSVGLPLAGKPTLWNSVRVIAPQFRRIHLVLLAAAVMAVVGCQHAGRKAAATPPAPYLRVANQSNGVVALEVALRQLAPSRKSAPAVWLVGVTHIGSPEYYRDLQEFLDAQAVVLFEGVGATNRDFALRDDEYSLQDAMARALGLEFQLNAINYERPHFRNSDLTAAQIARHFGVEASEKPDAAPGGSPPANEFGTLVQIMQGTGLLGGLAKVTVSLISLSPRLQAATKLAMIETMGSMPPDLATTPGLTPGMQRLLRVLIEERNHAVVTDTQRALREKPRPKSVAIFYGAGHMHDLEARLRAELRYRPGEERWLTAFAVDPRASGISRNELDFMRRIIRQQLQGVFQTGTSTTNAPPLTEPPRRGR